MPHITAVFAETEKAVVNILRNDNNKLAIRNALGAEFPQYPIKNIAIIPKIIAEHHLQFCDNLLPLEFVIDVGKQDRTLNDKDSARLSGRMLAYCPDLKDVHFGAWLREMSSNGFTECKIGE